MDSDPNVVRVIALIDADGAGGWRAVGTDPATKGIYATGEDFASARAALADLVSVGLASGAIPTSTDPQDITGIRIYATTRKTFPGPSNQGN